MYDVDFDVPLELLEQILGRKVTFVTPDEEILDPSTPEHSTGTAQAQRMEIGMDPVEEAEKGVHRLAVSCDASKYRDVDSATLRIREPVDETVALCPWSAIIGYSSFFIGKTNKPRAQPFFDKILEGKTWDFFYLYDPKAPEEPATLFVPTAQFDRFLEGINAALGIALTIPPGANSKRFCFAFGQGGTPRPRYLKRVRDERTLSIDTWPEQSEDDIEAFNSATPADQVTWMSQYKRTKAEPSVDRTAAAARRRETRLLANRSMLTQSQSHLSLGTPENCGEHAVFISIDIEAIEVPPHPISEVGIAILDTADIEGTSAGPGGCDWWCYVKAHHIRTKEYSGLVNYRYVQGCPDAFNFGTSVSSPQADLVSSIGTILTPYIKRNQRLVLVGHDIRSDFKMLMNLGYNIQGLPGIVCELDTQGMHQAWKKTERARSLEVALSDLGIENRNLHNAGNDAVYTLRAMMGIALEGIRQGDAEKQGKEYKPALWTDDSTEKQMKASCNIANK